MNIGQYFGNMLVSIDQLGNTIAGGDPDNTISARVGYYTHHGETIIRPYWNMLEHIINITFWPVDGKGHCHMAYHNDAGEKFEVGGNYFVYLVLTPIIILTCIPLCLFFYLLYILGLARPKSLNYQEEIIGRLGLINQKLAGVTLEIEEKEQETNGSVVALPELVNAAKEMLDHANSTHKEIKSREVK
jgi:hypothetical protein